MIGQIIPGGNNNALNTSVTEYCSLWGRVNNGWNSTENSRRQIITGNGRLHSLRMHLDAAAGQGTYTFDVRLNKISTSLSVALTHPVTDAFNGIDIAQTAKGDILTFRVVPTGSSSVGPIPYWSVIYEDDDDPKRIIFMGGKNNALPKSLPVERNGPHGGTNWGPLPVAGTAYQILGRGSGNIRDLYVELSAAPGTGKSWQFDIQGNSGSDLSVLIADLATKGNDSSVEAFSANDKYNLKCTPSGTSLPTVNAFWGYSFDPDDERLIMGGSTDRLATEATEYNYFNLANHTWNGTLANRQGLVAQLMVIGNLSIETSRSPAATNSWKFTVMRNGVATDMEVTIDGTSTAGDDTAVEIFAPGDLISFRNIPVFRDPTGIPPFDVPGAMWSCEIMVASLPNSGLGMMGMGI